MMKKSVLAVFVAGWFCAGCAALTHAQSAAGYAPPQLAESNAWSLLIVPDTQSYAKYARNQGICDLKTAWIAENLENLNVVSVLHVGDIVEQNNIDKPKLRNYGFSFGPFKIGVNEPIYNSYITYLNNCGYNNLNNDGFNVVF